MEKAKRSDLRDVVPIGWREKYDHVWLTLYSIAMGAESEFKLAKRVELTDAILIAFWGSMNYLDPSSLQVRFSSEGNLVVEGAVSQCDSGVGAWLIVLQPCCTNSPPNEYSLKVKASAFASLLIGVTTRNFAYSRVVDNCISLASDQASAASAPVLGPHAYSRPVRSGLDVFHHAANLLAQMPNAEQRRVELSLHWYDKALRGLGVDSFLSNWIAIETLAMQNTTNIRPINERLSDIYEIPYSEAAEKFCAGRLLGLRSRIVHNGEDLIVQGAMSDYMNRLYEDLLHSYLGLKSGRLGEIALTPGFAFEDLLSP